MRGDAIQRKGMTVTERRADTSIFLARDLAEPGLRTSLAVRLVGGALFSEKAMLSDNSKGAIVKYERTLSQRRTVYWTVLAKKANEQAHRLCSNLGIPITIMLHTTPHPPPVSFSQLPVSLRMLRITFPPLPHPPHAPFPIVRLEFEAGGRHARRGQDPLAAIGHRG